MTLLQRLFSWFWQQLMLAHRVLPYPGNVDFLGIGASVDYSSFCKKNLVPGSRPSGVGRHETTPEWESWKPTTVVESFEELWTIDIVYRWKWRLVILLMKVVTRMLKSQHDVNLFPPSRLVPDITKLTHLTIDETDKKLKVVKLGSGRRQKSYFYMREILLLRKRNFTFMWRYLSFVWRNLTFVWEKSYFCVREILLLCERNLRSKLAFLQCKSLPCPGMNHFILIKEKLILIVMMLSVDLLFLQT